MKIAEHTKPALRTALIYFIFGFLWILLSDRFVHQLSPALKTEQQLQTYKGWFFILFTTVMLFFIVKHQIRMMMRLRNKLMKTEHRFNQMVNLTHDLIWRTDAQGKILQINDACEEILGYPPEEIIGTNYYELVPEDFKNIHHKEFEQKLKNGDSYIDFESQAYHRDGSIVYLKDALYVVRNDEGEILRIEGASTNVTAYKTYEKELVQNQQRLELAMYGGEIGLWEFEVKEDRLIINEGWQEILGLEVDQRVVNFNTIRELVHPEDIEALNETFGQPAVKSEDLITAEVRMKHANGTYRWISVKGRVTKWEGAESISMMGAINNITERKNLELELKNLVKLYSSFISYSSEGIYLFELNEPMSLELPIEEQIDQLYHNGYIRTCNDAFAKMYGFETGDDMVGADQITLHGSDNDPTNIELLRRFINSGYRVMNDITRETDKEGNVLYISNNVVGIVEDGKLLRTWGSQQNITEQVLSQQKVEESENHFRLLFETNPAPLLIFDAGNLRFWDVNKAMEKLLGLEKSALLDITFADILKEPEGFNGNDLAQKTKCHSVTSEIELINTDKKAIPCEIKFDKICLWGRDGILGAVNDLTGIKDAEKLVIQSLIEGADNERLRVAKELHDGLGQNLTAASLNLNSVMEESDKMSEKCLEKFSNGIRFLKSAIEESRNIAHNLMPKAIVDYGIILSLNSLFNQIEKSTDLKIRFFENMGEDVRLDLQTELNLYRITQEAINNVIKHAEATEVFVQLMLHPSEIIFTFEDNGKGFDKIVADTGKKGIGMKSIYNRAKAMSGYCDIDSAPGQGTTITVVIPI